MGLFSTFHVFPLPPRRRAGEWPANQRPVAACHFFPRKPLILLHLMGLFFHFSFLPIAPKRRWRPRERTPHPDGSMNRAFVHLRRVTAHASSAWRVVSNARSSHGISSPPK